MTDLPDVSVDALRRVARGILFDRHGAEDVVQEAWLAELRANPPVASRAGWLTVVVRNLALNRRREEARRGRRERAVARPEAQGDPSEGLAHIEVLRRLLDALERLDEPYRSAIVLRYLEEQPPRAIAKRLGVPVNTVRTHVRRGLERLRRDLDGERGEDRQASLAALVPFAGGIPWTAGLGTGGAVLMQKKLALAGLVALLLGAAYFVLRPGRAALRSATAPVELAAAPATVPAPREEPRPSLAPARAAVEGQRESAAQPMTVTGAWVVRGHAFRKLGQSFPGLALRGRVYAGTKTEGIPLLEARFAADENGDFAWPLEPPSELVTVQVAPEPTGHVPMSAWEVFLPGDPAPERFVVRAMPLDCTVRGRVLDPERRPVSGAHVRERDRIEEQETTTDAEGRYALHIPADSERRLRIHAPGLAQTTITVNAAEPGEVQAPDVVLQPELRVRGVVRDEEGQPVAGALVKPAHPFRWVSATTGPDGAFELGTLDREAQYLALEAHREGYVSASKRLDGEERDAPVELVLARGTRVVGRVSGPDGAPVWGAWISIGYYPWSDPRIEAWSDREGRFELTQVPVGAQTLWAWRTGFAQRRMNVEIRRDADPEVLEVVLEESHSIGGVVLDEEGQPLPWTMVYVEGRAQAYDTLEGFQSYAGSDGRFRFDGLPDVPLLVGALSQGRARAEVEVPGPGRDDLVVRLVRAAGFAGTVVDARTGAPVTEFVVRVGFPAREYADEAVGGYPASWSTGVSFVDAQGRWSLADDFEPGKYAALTIVAAGYAPADFEAVRTELAPDPAAFVARLSAGTLVRGRVVARTTGEPLVGARVRRVTAAKPYESLQHSDEPVLEAHSDSTGRFELADVPTGAMSLAVEHPEHTLALDGPFEVGAAPLERWIELGQGASVRGRLLDGRGEPLAGELVSISCLEGVERTTQRSTRTDADGAYALTGLSPGQYHLRWERHLGEHTAYDLFTRLELTGEETLERELRPRGRATLTGTLEYEGELPETTTVMLMPRPVPRPDGTYSHWAESGRAVFAVDGHFEAQFLEPGPYHVTAHVAIGAMGLAMGSAEVEVPEEGTLDVRIRLERRR